MLQHPNQQTAHHVDDHDQNTGDGIPTNKFTRTVHGAVKIGFLCHFRTAFFCFIFTNQSRIQIGVNRHLFTRHPIQHEARTHFRDTSRTFGDNHKVNDDENDEDHDTDGKVTADKEVTKGFHHLTCRRGTGMSFHQNDTR